MLKQFVPTDPGNYANASADVLLKLRQLELNQLDLKAIVDRRISEVSEELPLRLQTFISQFEKREQLQTQDINQKIAIVQETSIRAREQIRAKIIEVVESMQKIELREKELDYKLTSAFKQIEINSGLISVLSS